MRLNEKQNRRQKVTINLIVLAVALYGVSRRNLQFKETTAFENVMIGTFAPMQQSVGFIQRQFRYFFRTYLANINASKENIELKNAFKEQGEKLFLMEEIERENLRLKELLTFGHDLGRKKILAQVVAWDSASDFRVLRINKGLNHGVKIQSTVVTSDGVVGYVYRLTNNFSDILTVLDSNNRVDAIVKRTRSHGVVEGNSNALCIMKYVTRIDPVILGDQIITSGLGNIYPKGLLIGKVTRIERISYGITQDVIVTPSVDFSKLEEVVVLVSAEDQDRLLEWQALEGQDLEKKDQDK